MVLDPNDLRVSAYPPTPKTGMRTGKIPNGIRIEHIPSGIVAVCEKHRHQHLNRAEALADLEQKFVK